jgi:hypothetical protein
MGLDIVTTLLPKHQMTITKLIPICQCVRLNTNGAKQQQIFHPKKVYQGPKVPTLKDS